LNHYPYCNLGHDQSCLHLKREKKLSTFLKPFVNIQFFVILNVLKLKSRYLVQEVNTQKNQRGHPSPSVILSVCSYLDVLCFSSSMVPTTKIN
jgi:hypothetical protein